MRSLIFLTLTLHLVVGSQFPNVNFQLTASQVTPPKAREVYPYFVTSSVPALHDQLYRDVFMSILNNATFQNSQYSRVRSPFQFKNPDEVRSVLDFSLPDKRVDHKTLLELVNKVIEYSPRASHPYKVDRHGAGLDPYGLVGDWMGTAMSAPVLTYFLAPVFTLMEYEIQKRVRELIGYSEGKGDGMTAPGAGMGNGYVIAAALQSKFPNLKTKGFIDGGYRKQPVMFVSEQASFAYKKYCIWEGIGSDALVKIKVDKKGRMDMRDLEQQIQAAIFYGSTPFLIVGTAGTPVLGAIDPLKKISEIATKYKLWFHVDGQLSGATFLSQNQKGRISGVELSDSFLWSADKGLAAPFVTSILVTREEGIMKKTFGFGAAVIFRPSPLYNNSVWDNGDSTMQTTRRPDILKIWFMWKAKGQSRLAQHVDHTFDMTAQTVEEIKSRGKSFELILDTFDSNQVAFRYIPRSVRGQSKFWRDSFFQNSRFTQKLKARLLRNGILSISVNTLKDTPAFFVMSLGNSVLTRDDVNYMLDQIESEGEKQSNVKSFLEELGKFGIVDEILNKLEEGDDENRQIWPWRTTAKTTTTTTSTTTEAPQRQPTVPDRPATYPDYVSAPIAEMHSQFMADFFGDVLDYATYFEDKRNSQSQPALLWRKPEELLKEFDFSLDSTTGTGTMKDNEAELLQIWKNIVKYSGHLSHPYYNFQLVLALDPYTLMADYVLAGINSQMLTYEDNPIFTTMEDEVTRAVRRRVGYPENGDGLVLPGGSAANQIALLLAHIAKIPEAKEGGHIHTGTLKPLVAFLSVAAHYATNKGAFFNGIGTDNCVYVAQDYRGRMNVTALREAVQKAKREGKIPFLVVATAGTTVLGAIDPIDEIADVCQENGMWLHVDGSYGGSAIMSSNETRKAVQFKGLDRTDSFTFNPHKVFGSTRESTVFVTRSGRALEKVAPMASDQEFNNRELYDAQKYDSGINQLFTDRRGNVFKMWFMWKAKGLEGLGAHVDYGYETTAAVQAELERRNDSFIVAHPGFPPDCTSVNFYYVPERLRQADRKSAQFWKDIEKVQSQILKEVISSNRMVISNEPVSNHPPYLILSLYNSALTKEDGIFMLDVVDEIGKKL